MVGGLPGTPTQPTYYVATSSGHATPVQNSPGLFIQPAQLVPPPPPPMPLPMMATPLPNVPAAPAPTTGTSQTVCVLNPTQPPTGTCFTVHHPPPPCACPECTSTCTDCAAKRKPTCQCGDCKKKAEDALRDKAKRDEAERWVSRIRRIPLSGLKGLSGPEMQEQIDRAVEEVQLHPQAFAKSALCAIHNYPNYATGLASTPQVRHNRHKAEVFVSDVLGIPLYVAQGIGASQLQVLCDAAMTSIHQYHFG